MSEPAESGRGESALDRAIRRLERSGAMLEARLQRRSASAAASASALIEADRARLASELDAARARIRELEDLGAEASAALGEAISRMEALDAPGAGPL